MIINYVNLAKESIQKQLRTVVLLNSCFKRFVNFTEKHLWYRLNESIFLIKRSSHPEMFCKNSIPKNFTKLTGKHLCQSLFFIKIAGLRPATLLKQTLALVFCCGFCEIFRNTFFIEHVWWLLLNKFD